MSNCCIDGPSGKGGGFKDLFVEQDMFVIPIIMLICYAMCPVGFTFGIYIKYLTLMMVGFLMARFSCNDKHHQK